MATRTRRIVIRRKRSSLGTIPKQQPAPAIYCMWCFTEKNNAVEKCACCGHFGSTNRTQREISQVFITSGEL